MEEAQDWYTEAALHAEKFKKNYTFELENYSLKVKKSKQRKLNIFRKTYKV